MINVKQEQGKKKQSSLNPFKLDYKKTNDLNTICGIYIIFVGNISYVIKTTSSIASSVSRQYKALVKGTHTLSALQEVFNRSNKAFWFTVLVSLPIRIGDDKKSYNDVIDCLYYSILKGIQQKHLVANKIFKEPDATVLNCLILNRYKQIKAMNKSIDLINNIFKVGPIFDFNVINVTLQKLDKYVCLYYIYNINNKTKPIKLLVNNSFIMLTS